MNIGTFDVGNKVHIKHPWCRDNQSAAFATFLCSNPTLKPSFLHGSWQTDKQQATYHSCFRPRHCRSHSRRHTSRIAECTGWCPGHSWTHSHDTFLYLQGHKEKHTMTIHFHWTQVWPCIVLRDFSKAFRDRKVITGEKSRNEAQGHCFDRKANTKCGLVNLSQMNCLWKRCNFV